MDEKQDQQTSANAGTSAPPPPPPPSTTPPPPAPAARRLCRRSNDRIIAGVAGGIADYFDVNPWLVRLAFVLLTFAGGSGGVLYILGIILLPRETDPPGLSPLEKFMASPGKHGWWPWVIIGIAVLALTRAFDLRPLVLWPLLLIALGVYLLRDEREPQVATASAGHPAPVPEVSTGITTPAYGGTPAYTPRKRHRRKRSGLHLLTLGAALFATGVAIALVESGAADLHPQQVLAVPMIVLGIGLLTSAFAGKARVLAVEALLLLPFVVVSGVANVPQSTRTGLHIYDPATLADVSHDYRIGAGRMIVDLSKIHTGPDPYDIKISGGAGEIAVLIPGDVPTAIDAKTGIGRVDLLGHANSGTSVELQTHTPGAGGELKLNIRNGVGYVFVTDDPNAREVQR